MLPLSSCLEHFLMLEMSALQFTRRECKEKRTKQQSDQCPLLPTPPDPCMNWTSHYVNNNNNEYLERQTRTGPKRLQVLYKYILSEFNAYNMNAHTHTHMHPHTQTRTRVRAQTNTHTINPLVCWFRTGKIGLVLLHIAAHKTDTVTSVLLLVHLCCMVDFFQINISLLLYHNIRHK